MGFIVPDMRPTEQELDEFRNAVAMAAAYHRKDFAELHVLCQLVQNPDLYVLGLRSLVEILLLELDTQKRDSADTLAFVTEQAATTPTKK